MQGFKRVSRYTVTEHINDTVNDLRDKLKSSSKSFKSTQEQ